MLNIKIIINKIKHEAFEMFSKSPIIVHYLFEYFYLLVHYLLVLHFESVD